MKKPSRSGERGWLATVALILACAPPDEAPLPGDTTSSSSGSTASSPPGPNTAGDATQTTSASPTEATSAADTDADSSSSGTAEETGTGEPSEGSFWVFITANEGVSTWSMDPSDGALTLAHEQPIGVEVGPLAIRPDLSALYVGIRPENRAEAYAIDPVTAELTLLGSLDLELNPVYLSTDQTGSYLLSTTFNGSEFAIFPIEADGSLGGPATQRLATLNRGHAIVTNDTNEWLVVPHRDDTVVAQYAFDANTGTATPNPVPLAAAAEGSGPRHIVFHPDGDFAYLANEFSDSVSTFAFDVTTGQLSLLDTVSTLPPDFPGDDNTCADVHVTPDGRFVYVSNRGHDSIAMFAVDPATGVLSSLGQILTEPHPREFDISPRGRYVYVAGRDSGMLASYTVDDTDGMLIPGPVYDVGATPLWVLPIELPGPG